MIVLRSPRRPRLRWLGRWLWWTVVPIVAASYALDWLLRNQFPSYGVAVRCPQLPTIYNAVPGDGYRPHVPRCRAR